MLYTFVHLTIAAIVLLGGASIVLATEKCDDYYMGQKGRWAVCPNYCCGSLFYRTCCSNCFQAYPTRSCDSPPTTRSFSLVLVALAVLFILLATVAVILFYMKCCAVLMEEETVLIAPPQPAVTVTAQYPGTSGGPLPPYPGVPPAYGAATGYSQAPNVVVVKQSAPPPAYFAPPLIAPVPLLMPVPYGGFGEHHYHYGGGGNMDAPITVGDYGGFDAPISSGFN